MALALEQIRRMRGGAQSHLMRCVAASSGSVSRTASSPIPSSSPGGVSSTRKREEYDYYVVKFQNNSNKGYAFGGGALAGGIDFSSGGWLRTVVVVSNGLRSCGSKRTAESTTSSAMTATIAATMARMRVTILPGREIWITAPLRGTLYRPLRAG